MPIEALSVVILITSFFLFVESIVYYNSKYAKNYRFKNLLFVNTSLTLWISCAYLTLDNEIEEISYKNIEMKNGSQFITDGESLINLNKELGIVVSENSKIKKTKLNQTNLGIKFNIPPTYEVENGSQEKSTKH